MNSRAFITSVSVNHCCWNWWISIVWTAKPTFVAEEYAAEMQQIGFGVVMAVWIWQSLNREIDWFIQWCVHVTRGWNVNSWCDMKIRTIVRKSGASFTGLMCQWRHPCSTELTVATANNRSSVLRVSLRRRSTDDLDLTRVTFTLTDRGHVITVLMWTAYMQL